MSYGAAQGLISQYTIHNTQFIWHIEWNNQELLLLKSIKTLFIMHKTNMMSCGKSDENHLNV